jgi:hypothetical protein
MERMTHPITPPPELVQQWIQQSTTTECTASQVATRAAQWGADQELEACCEVLARELICDGKHVATDLRMIRRPKLPSLKEQALEQLESVQCLLDMHKLRSDTIRRALEAL